MADDTEDQSPLDQFVGLFSTPEARGLAQEASTRINDYLTRRQIADDNTAAGDAFAANLHEMRSNFVGLVQRDPHATDLALDLAQLGVGGMVNTIPGTDPAHAENIAQGMQRDIAHAAVRTLAEQHEDQARALLDSDRISALVGDDKEALHGYITAQSTARQIDAQGQQKMAAKAAVAQTNQAAWGYMASVVDPDTGEIGHPAGWAQTLMADQSIPPPMKAALFDTYGRLQEQGDVPVSDPSTVRAVLQGGASPVEILTHAGGDLKAADAVYLAKLASDPAARGRVGQIANVIELGRQELAAPENGPAGQRAFRDYSDWALANARNGADLDPGSQAFLLAGNRLQQFAPRASDTVDTAVQAPVEGRKSLDDIFGGGKRV